MRRHLTVRSAGAALVLSLTLVVAGCGGSDDEPASDDAAPSSSASPGADEDDAVRTPGSDATPNESPKSPGGSAPSTDLPQGEDVKAADVLGMITASFRKGGTANVSLETSGNEAATVSKGVVDYSTTPASMKLTVTTAALEGQESEVLLVDKNLYMNMGDLSEGKYLKMPLDGEQGAMFDVSQLDLAQSFGSSAENFKSLKFSGKEKVGKLDLVRYDAVVDSANIFGSGRGAAGVDRPKTIKYAFFFDADSMLRRVQMDMGKLGSTTMTYDDWGTKVSIKAPAAKDVMEMPAIPDMPPEPTD